MYMLERMGDVTVTSLLPGANQCVLNIKVSLTTVVVTANVIAQQMFVPCLNSGYSIRHHPLYLPKSHHSTPFHFVPDSRFLIALDLASSSVVTHLCLSTSFRARRWYTWDGPLVMTKLVASIVSMKAPARFTVPRHVCAISSCVLRQSRLVHRTNDRSVH